MADTYRHTQVGWVLLGALGVAAAAVVVTGVFVPWQVNAPILAVLLGCMAAFPSLTVIGGPEGLEVRFGIGPVRRRFRWDEIVSAAPVTNHWALGWGIRWIGRGWMFNVSGLKSVELRLRSGRVFRIGTDEPETLHAFIAHHLQRAAG